MAQHLANIFGTEKDRVNCPFYFKIGYVMWPRPAPVLHRENCIVRIRVCFVLILRISFYNLVPYGASIRP